MFRGIWIDLEGNPCVGKLAELLGIEAAGENPNDGVRVLAECEGFSDHLRVIPELTFPKLVAEQHDTGSGGTVLILRKGPAVQNWDSKKLEKAGTHARYR